MAKNNIKSKKIGVITIMDYTNIGNRLQNYAMSFYLKNKFFCDVQVLTATLEVPYKNNRIRWLKEKIILFLCHFPFLFEKRYGVDTIRWSNFIRWNRNIPIKNIYGQHLIPKEIDEEFDFFVVGSDQVWNYSFSSDKFSDYFLNFASDSKKIAISASMGVDNIPDRWKNVYANNLKKFYRISVRENSSSMIIKNLINIDVPVFIDPVMLLSTDEWNKVAIKPRVDINCSYIIVYFLGEYTIYKSEIEKWANQNGYIIYNLLDREKAELYTSGPGEFLSLIANAKLVLTDSFHCTAFSIIYSVPFIVFPRTGMNCDMSSRLNTLLELFGFQNRWNKEVSKKDYLNCDFSKVPEIIKKEQNRVYDFICDFLMNK